MNKTAKYQNKVNGQTISIYSSWKSAHSPRHFMVISRIGAEHTTIKKERAYPTLEAATAKISQVEKWLASNQI